MISALSLYTFECIFHSFQPVKVTLPGGELYSISYDREGNLQHVTMPTRAIHSYQVLYSMGFVRKLYMAPQSDVPFIQDFDFDGKLLCTVYPSNQRRVVYLYNDHGWPSEIVFDSTLIKYDYEERTGLVKSVHQMSHEFDAMTDFQHVGTLITEMVYRYVIFLYLWIYYLLFFLYILYYLLCLTYILYYLLPNYIILPGI